MLQRVFFSRLVFFGAVHRFLAAIFGLVALVGISSEAETPRQVSGMRVTDQDRDYWAFRPLTEMHPPRAEGNPIDAYLYPAGSTPPEASRRTLIRRVFLDLLGLPPTPDQVVEFERDASPDAYERLVDRTLASRHFGERWGRHWLDVARYADSDGYESDLDRHEAWPYRDWVIRAFNDDLPFNSFVQWQIAGDEIAPTRADAVIATGFLAGGPSQMTTPADTEENKLKIRYDELDDMVSTMGSAFLGLTVGCARCHDHKFDPIPTLDYYRLVATFSTTDRQVAALSKPRRDFERWKENQRSAIREVRMTQLGLTEDQKFWLRQPEHFFVPIQTQLYKQYGERLKIGDAQLLQALPESGQKLWDALEGAAAHAQFNRLPSERSLVVLDRQADPAPEYLLARGGVLNRKAPVTAGFLQVLSRGKSSEDWIREVQSRAPHDADRVLRIDSEGFARPATTYQRQAMAQWLTDVRAGAGPLVARVMVNRIWQHHFGDGLVRTPNDFGHQSDAPAQSQLMEWLAGELVRQSWKMKPLHKIILMSAAYRQATGGESHAEFTRHPVRMESDVLRDTMLAVSGQLNRKMFGPPFHAIIPKEAISSRAKDEYPTQLQEGPELWRRNIYAFNKRSVPNPMMEVFDAPDSGTSCGRRNVTTIPTQALTLINSEWVRRAAVQFAQRVITDVGTEPDAQIDRAYHLALSRSPEPGERERARRFLDAAPDATGDALAVEGLTDLCHVLFTLNEFIYVD